MSAPKKLIKEVETVEELLKYGNRLLNLVIQDLDLSELKINWNDVEMANTSFMGCKIPFEVEKILRSKGAMIYPKIYGRPYNPYRINLYTWQELMEGYSKEKDESIDYKIYIYSKKNKLNSDINEALAQTIHDNSVYDGIKDLLEFDDDGMTTKKCVGIMGGHGVARTEKSFTDVALITKDLTEKGYFILSGGGPGIMEAANLGAYFAGKSEEELLESIKVLKKAPTFKDEGYIESSKEVLEKHTEGKESLAIPTWFYGHEPSNLFASHIAKFFSNAIREDILLSASLHGIIYAPGSAGTIQEIFTDAAQNHYGSLQFISPMVFMDTKYWTETRPVYPLAKQLSEGKTYGEMLTILDERSEIVKFIVENPPREG